MLKKTIKIKYYLGDWNESTWKGSIEKAMNIALAEIHEHAGSSSAAYAFTNAIFNEFKKEMK